MAVTSGFGKLKQATAAQPESANPQRRLLRGYLHKTSNSLCGIKGYAGLILAGEGRAAGTARWAEKIIAEIERMEEIFRSVGDLTTTPGHANADADLAHVVTEALAGAARRHANLHFDNGLLLVGDLLLPAADLSQILAALLDNSAESRSDGSAVTVTLTGTLEPTGRISLTLRDDGPGIPANVLRQATEPFMTTKDGHLGIGLSRVETLLDMYGLTWALRSSEETGTVVTLEVGAPLVTSVELV